MAELAREGGAYRGAALAPTEIADCFCNLEGDSEPVTDRTCSRRKNSGRAGIATPMLLHLTPKQLLVARKPTLMDDLITRNKTALLQNKMERTRASKSKRSDVDSDPEPLAVKRLRSNEPLKHTKSRKPSEDRKVRVSTRRFMSSLRSGKKRSHIKEASLLERKKKSFKSSGTRSNDSETDTPLSYSSSKPNGHPIDNPASKPAADKTDNKNPTSKPASDKADNKNPISKPVVDKTDNKNPTSKQATDKTDNKNPTSPSVLKNKPSTESKPSSSQTETNEPPTKKIRKKRRKFDSMVWLKKAKQKHHQDTKSPNQVLCTKIKAEPLSEPEDSGLGSEMRLDLAKSDERLPQAESNIMKEENVELEETKCDTKILTTSAGKHIWTIETFEVSPLKESPLKVFESNGSLEESHSSTQQDLNLKPKLLDLSSEILEPTVSPELGVAAAMPESSATIKVEDTTKSVTQLSAYDVSDEQQPADSPVVESDSNDIDSEVSLSPIEGEVDSQNNITKEIDANVQDSFDSVSESVSDKCLSEERNPSLSVEVEESTVTIEKSDNLVIENIDSKPLSDSDDTDNPPSEECKANAQSEILSTINLSIENESAEVNESCSSDSLILKQIEEVVEPEDKCVDESKLEPETKIGEEEGSSCVVLDDVSEQSSVAVTETETIKDVHSHDGLNLENEETEICLDDPLDVNDRNCDTSNLMTVSSETTAENCVAEINESKVIEELETKEEVISEESEPCQADKADWLKALGLQSLRPVAIPPQAQTSLKDVKIEDKPSKLTDAGYTGTLKAVIKLNKGAPRSIVFKNNEDAKPTDCQINNTEAAASGVPITHLTDIANPKKVKDVLPTDYDTVSNSSYVSGAPQSDSGESDEEKVHGKESNLIIPEKSSSFSIHPGRLCCDVCCYCFGKFGSLDTPCHIAQLKGEERQQKILQNEPYLTVDSCLCDACYRYVDRKANCPSSAAAKTAKRARPPAATLCCVTDCTQPATHSVKRKWLLKIKRSLANKFEIDTEKHTSVFNPLCSNHHYWVDYYMVCGICRKRLNRNHLYTLGPETDKLNLVLAEDGIPARLSDKLFLCKLCRYYANMRLKYSDPTTIPPSSQPFYTNYRKKILASLDVPVSDSDEDKPKPKEGKDEDVMSLSGLATLLSDQPDPNHPRIQVKFGNVNIGTLSNLNIGQGRQEERSSFDRNEPALPLNAAFDFQGPSTSDGSWEKVTSTLQFDKKTKQLWQDLQRPYGNQSSFLRHLVMLEKYWRSGYLVLSGTADPRAAKYINSVQTRNKSFEGKSEVKDIKIETPPPAEPSPTPPPVPETILKVPDPAKRFIDETPVPVKTSEPQKISLPHSFCPLIPTGEVEVLPVNPNTRNVPKEKPVSKGTVIIQRSSSSQPPNTSSPCKIMITNVQSLAKPKVDPVLLNRAKSLVRMVSPGVSRQRPPSQVPIQRLPSRMARPRQQFQFVHQPYQTLQAQLQAPPSNHPLQSLQQVVLNRYPPPLVKINQQATAQQRIPTPKSQSPGASMQQQTSQASVSLIQQQSSQPAVSLIHQLQQPSVSLLQQQQSHSINLLQQQHQPVVTLIQQQQQPAVSLVQQPSVSLIQQQQPSMNVQMQGQQHSVSLLQQQPNVTLMQNHMMNSQSTLKAGPPPPYSLRPLLPKLPPSLSISTTPQSTTPTLPPSVSLLPPSSSNGVVPSTSGSTYSSNSLPLPPVSTLTSISSQLLPPPPYSSSGASVSHISTPTMTTPSVSLIPTSSIGNLRPAVTVIPASLPSSITLPTSGITIEKQPHNFSSPPILPPEKPIISVFREPLPTDT